MNITSGIIEKAQKVVIYGPEGIGKSTFASQFPNPLFCDTEGSTEKLNVRRFDKPHSWQMIFEQIDYIIANPNICKTYIIDTIDWAEQLCIKYICDKAGKKGIEDFGYGNGYVYEKEEFGKLLNKLEELKETGINVVLTAHAQIRKFEQPDEMGAYDRWELKLGKKTSSQISPLVKEWADMVLFANYKTYSVQTDKDGKKHKAQGGNRVMYTSHHPCWDAKNRHGLKDELEFSFSEIDHCIPKDTQAPIYINEKSKKDENAYKCIEDNLSEIKKAPISDDIPPQLRELMKANNVTEDDIMSAVEKAGYFPQGTPIKNYGKEFIDGCLIGAWNQVLAKIMAEKDLPF